MRLFVAVPVPDEVRRAVARSLDAWRERPDGAEGWRWTRPEGWHVTVAFLGEVDDAEVDRVVSAVRAGVTPTPPLLLRLGEVGRFGSRVLYVAVDDEPPGALAALGRDVQAALSGEGLPVQEREVRGHLTLARATRHARIDRVPDLEVPARSWRADGVAVEVSRPQRGGARYETLARVALGR
jgi:RNA 2',3'-cyclic 3'-phosphodiesterase